MNSAKCSHTRSGHCLFIDECIRGCPNSVVPQGFNFERKTEMPQETNFNVLPMQKTPFDIQAGPSLDIVAVLNAAKQMALSLETPINVHFTENLRIYNQKKPLYGSMGHDRAPIRITYHIVAKQGYAEITGRTLEAYSPDHSLRLYNDTLDEEGNEFPTAK